MHEDLESSSTIAMATNGDFARSTELRKHRGIYGNKSLWGWRTQVVVVFAIVVDSGGLSYFLFHKRETTRENNVMRKHQSRESK